MQFAFGATLAFGNWQKELNNFGSCNIFQYQMLCMRNPQISCNATIPNVFEHPSENLH